MPAIEICKAINFIVMDEPERYSKIYSRILARLWMWLCGETYDIDTGLHNLSYCAALTIKLIHQSMGCREYEFDDRPFHYYVESDERVSEMIGNESDEPDRTGFILFDAIGFVFSRIRYFFANIFS